ncbi:HTH_Tnp_Tc3_2 domain-containing protein [Trichonephila clavipes]|nr:HTH_Tnp_Tc3_2 domain-containing protein [Trichonephila clavipes]
MADCEVEGTIDSLLASPREGNVPDVLGKERRRNIRTRESVWTAREADAHQQSRDLSIVKDDLLRNFMEKGTGFRLMITKNKSNVMKQIIKDLDKFYLKMAIKYGMPIEAFNQFRSYVATEIRELDFTVENEIMYKDLKSSIVNIQNDFVITYVDKASIIISEKRNNDGPVRVRKRYDCWNEERWLLGDGNSHLYLGRARSTVSAVMTAYKKCGNVTSGKHSSGRKRKLTDRYKRVLTRIVARKRKQSLSQITSEGNSHLHNPISARTVQRELHASNLYGRVGISKPLATARHALQRRQWCRTHRQ